MNEDELIAIARLLSAQREAGEALKQVSEGWARDARRSGLLNSIDTAQAELERARRYVLDASIRKGSE